MSSVFVVLETLLADLNTSVLENSAYGSLADVVQPHEGKLELPAS